MLDPSTGAPLICGALFIDSRKAFFSLKNRVRIRPLESWGKLPACPSSRRFLIRGATRGSANKHDTHKQAYGEL
jgi:hypothetical protein